MILILVGLLCGIDSPVNEGVVEFARSKLGQRVGDGECTALAAEALRYAGASRSRSKPGVWGDQLESLKGIQPGDILQFDDAVFVRRRTRKDGAIIKETLSFPHHTAVVARVRKRAEKPVLVILHQNAGVPGGDNKVVSEWTIDLAEKRGGTVKAYRPVAD
jgi:hypothetical protein